MPAVYHKFTVLYVHPLQLSYKEHHAVSNHQQLNCLFSRLFMLTPKKTSKLHITGPLWGESTSDGWIPLTKGQWFGSYQHVPVTSFSCHGMPVILMRSISHSRLINPEIRFGWIWVMQLLILLILWPLTGWIVLICNSDKCSASTS